MPTVLLHRVGLEEDTRINSLVGMMIGESQRTLIISQMAILYQPVIEGRVYYAFCEPFPNDVRAPVSFCPLASRGLLVRGRSCWSGS